MKQLFLILFGILIVCKVAADSDAATTSKTAIPLADSQWRLLAFQSMDDTQGTIYPDAQNQYVMTLHRDGTVLIELACRSLQGEWSSSASADLTSGPLILHSLVSSEPTCLPPVLDEHIIKQAPYIRSYLLKDNRLYLSLMADGGIYAWKNLPLPTTPEN